MILNETVAAIAEAIREKTGKSELIAPVDFASEIKGITAGGGSGGGNDGWVYYKFDGKAVENIEGYDAAEFYSVIGVFLESYYISTVYRDSERMLYTTMNGDEHPLHNHLGFKTQTSVNLLRALGFSGTSAMPLKELIAYLDEMMGGQASLLLVAFANALTPCTKEEFEALITA
jgi:hypothetical protein